MNKANRVSVHGIKIKSVDHIQNKYGIVTFFTYTSKITNIMKNCLIIIKIKIASSHLSYKNIITFFTYTSKKYSYIFSTYTKSQKKSTQTLIHATITTKKKLVRTVNEAIQVKNHIITFFI